MRMIMCALIAPVCLLIMFALKIQRWNAPIIDTSEGRNVFRTSGTLGRFLLLTELHELPELYKRGFMRR
jgi:hypothetical protein